MIQIIKNKKHFVIHLLSWAFLLFVALTFMYLETGKIVFSVIFRLAFSIIVFYINYAVLVPLFLLQKKKILYFISVIILLFFSYFIISYLFSDIYINPNLTTQKVPRYLGIIFLTAINIIVGTIIRVYQQRVLNEKKKKEIETQKNATELEVLKNQLNLHFLFNSLNSIYSLTVKKSDDAPEAVIMLSELMRYMIYKADNDFVLLREELNISKIILHYTYANCQKRRCNDTN